MLNNQDLARWWAAERAAQLSPQEMLLVVGAEILRLRWDGIILERTILASPADAVQEFDRLEYQRTLAQ